MRVLDFLTECQNADVSVTLLQICYFTKKWFHYSRSPSNLKTLRTNKETFVMESVLGIVIGKERYYGRFSDNFPKSLSSIVIF